MRTKLWEIKGGRHFRSDPNDGGKRIPAAVRRITCLLYTSFCLFHNGQVGTDTGIIYRIKTEHADGGENPADAVFAGLEAEGFTQGNADSGGYLDVYKRQEWFLGRLRRAV